MLFTGPERPIKGIAAGNTHRQLQTKKRMEERNQGRRIPAQLPRIKIPLVSENSPKPQRQNPSDLPEAAERQEILRFVGNDLRTTE